jgi:hypothetical protein
VLKNVEMYRAETEKGVCTIIITPEDEYWMVTAADFSGLPVPVFFRAALEEQGIILSCDVPDLDVLEKIDSIFQITDFTAFVNQNLNLPHWPGDIRFEETPQPGLVIGCEEL